MQRRYNYYRESFCEIEVCIMCCTNANLLHNSEFKEANRKYCFFSFVFSFVRINDCQIVAKKTATQCAVSMIIILLCFNSFVISLS